MPTAETTTPPTTIIAARPLKNDSFIEIHDMMSARDAIWGKIVANREAEPYGAETGPTAYVALV